MNYTFTKHLARCGHCGRTFRVSQEFIDTIRDGYPEESAAESDAEVATHAEMCLSCATDDLVDGEHPVDRKAFQFFAKHAGGVVGENARGALALARAEAMAADVGITFDWIYEPDPDLSWMTDRERAQEHEVLACLAVIETEDDQHHITRDVLASLGNIVDADATYRRVVEAELAEEALDQLAIRDGGHNLEAR